MNKPFFSIITITYKDAWNLSKTMQSVLSQNQSLFEYIIIDGDSNDETEDIINFWSEKYTDIIQYVKEKDSGVYDAMNKGIKESSGKYICFMNAGDKFKDNYILDLVKDNLVKNPKASGLLGWGSLGSEIYVPWVNNVGSYLIGTLGFCHQSLFLKADLLNAHMFDDSIKKIDSDRVQLSYILENYEEIYLLHDVLSIRSNDLGLSANAELLISSSVSSISRAYRDISIKEARYLIDFKYSLTRIEEVQRFLADKSDKSKFDIALMVLDVLVMNPKKRYIDPVVIENMVSTSVKILGTTHQGSYLLNNLQSVSLKKAHYYEGINKQNSLLSLERSQLLEKERYELSSFKSSANTDIIVSLTSFPGRLDSLHLVLNSLFNQTLRPNIIHLYLGNSEFVSHDKIPDSIKNFKSMGLKIFLVKNIFQYKKYVYLKSINEYSPVITVDDDTIYPTNMIEKLVEFHKKYPSVVICNRNHLITYDEKGNTNPYQKWKKEFVNTKPSHDNFATGVGGVLYPKGFIDEYCINSKLIMRHAPYADDVWLKINAIRRNIKVVSTDLMSSDRFAWYRGYTPEMRVDTLQDFNVQGGLNDYQMQLSEGFLKSKGVFNDY